jgi:hypothetical protein
MCAQDQLHRLAIRAALRIHGHLAGTGRLAGLVKLPSPQWDDVVNYVRRLDHSLGRGWRAASESLLSDVDYALRRLRAELDTCHANLPRAAITGKLAAPRDLVADILALDDEFDGLRIDLQQKVIRVQTDDIVLEETALGSFRIVLHWDWIGRSRPYQVFADTPRCPEHDRSVTHPHVREETLCEGEGSAAIRRALTEGRLLDFFTLARQVLETYNPASAYVQLDRWNGVACRDCAYQMPADDYGVCDRCESPLCNDCSTCCRKCDRYICSSCSLTCDGCDGCFCDGCMQGADDSDRLLCSSCFEQTLEEEPDDNSCPTENDPPLPAECQASAGAPIAANSLCVGQTAVPA